MIGFSEVQSHPIIDSVDHTDAFDCQVDLYQIDYMFRSCKYNSMGQNITTLWYELSQEAV